MAPSRGKRVAGSSRVARRDRAFARQPKDEASDIYDAMVAEAEVAEWEQQESDRPLKKRKKNRTAENPQLLNKLDHSSDPDTRVPEQQIVEASSDSESDYGFEDVPIDRSPSPKDITADDADDDIVDISVSVDGPSTPKRYEQVKRKPVTGLEKTFRLLVHKFHVLCLLWHCLYVNRWCNHLELQRTLRPLLSKKIISYLNPSVNESQFQRNRSFIDGLEQASQLFRAHFKITASGLRRACWSSDRNDESVEELPEPVDRKEFLAAAQEMEGSQDTANQLFCALLRSVGVEARLTCSLQPLPFLNPPSRTTPRKSTKETAFVITTTSAVSDLENSPSDSSVQNPPSTGKSSVRRRLGQPSFAPEPRNIPRSRKKKPIRTLSYPVFWVEAFNTAYQKWVPVDPVVTLTVNKASKIEPPSSYELNRMSYVIAFEASGVARDVTRRYTKSYNAKTRRQRVENSEGGAEWLEKALQPLRRRQVDWYKDQIEDAELAQREARERLPANVLDFKDHPYYALERHLKRHEVIHPKRKVGNVNAGTAAKPRMEPVYRRQDVLVCRSADKWYRLGRVVRLGEQPTKYVRSRQRQRQSSHDDNGSGQESEHTSLYSQEQTEVYVAEPVKRGRVPRNRYGNVDVYVPSMVPENGTHIRDQLAKTAAKILRVDHADAVTGFQFKGRRGTAVIEGAVVASEFADAVYAIIEGLKDQQTEEASMARSAIALKMWRRFLTGLRIVERVKGHAQDGADVDMQEELNAEEDVQEHVAEAGGFQADDGVDIAMPTAGRFSLDELHSEANVSKRNKRKAGKSDSDTEPDIDLTDESDAEHAAPEPTRRRKVKVDSSDEDDLAGDEFLGSEQAGGFLPDDDETGGDQEDILMKDEILEDSPTDGGGGFIIEGGDDAEVVPSDKTALLVQNLPNSNPTNVDVDSLSTSGEQMAKSERQQSVHLSQQETSDEELRFMVDQNTSSTHVRQDNVMKQTLPPGTNMVESLPLQHESEPQSAEKLDNETDEVGTAQDVDHDQQSEVGSMLSHDPDDEDAEPDWLESD